MKNTAPSRALRDRGSPGAAPPIAPGEGGAGGTRPRKMSTSGGHSTRGAGWQTSRGCERGETPCTPGRRLQAVAEKKRGRSPLPLSPRNEGAMARPAAHRAQEPDKGNADVGRERQGGPKERQRDQKATTAGQNSATKQIKRRQAQQTPPGTRQPGAGHGAPRPGGAQSESPPGGEGAKGGGWGCRARPGARGRPKWEQQQSEGRAERAPRKGAEAERGASVASPEKGSKRERVAQSAGS